MNKFATINQPSIKRIKSHNWQNNQKSSTLENDNVNSRAEEEAEIMLVFSKTGSEMLTPTASAMQQYFWCIMGIGKFVSAEVQWHRLRGAAGVLTVRTN